VALNVTFDWVNKLINILAPQTEVLIQDLINVIRNQEDELYPGISYDQIATAAGKDDLGGGITVGVTLTLINNWRLKFWEPAPPGYQALIRGGNLVGGIAGNPIAFTPLVQVRMIQSASGVIAETGVSGLTPEEAAELFSIKPDIRGVDNDTLKTLSGQLDIAQADLDNPDQYKADVSGLALESTVQDIKDKTDQLTFTIPGKVDATAELTAEEHDQIMLIDDIKVETDKITDMQADLKRILGLVHENVFIDLPVYDPDNNLISARVRIYSSASNVGTDIGVIGSYLISSDPAGLGKFNSWRQERI